MNDYQNISDNDYTIINNITYDELICNQEPTNYSMMFFCIKQNRSNKLVSTLSNFFYRLMKKSQPSYRDLIIQSVNCAIFLLILLSINVVLLVVHEGGIGFIVTSIIVVLLLYFVVQTAIESWNSITIKIAEFKVGTSEINRNLLKKGYDKLLLKQYIINSNRFELVHIQKTDNYANDIDGVFTKVWPFSQIRSFYNEICHYAKRIRMIKTYYFKMFDIVETYDNNDRYCISYLSCVSDSIMKVHNNTINVDREIVLKNGTPIYCNDVEKHETLR